MKPETMSEISEAVARLCLAVGRELDPEKQTAGEAVALDPEDGPLVAGLLEITRTVIDTPDGLRRYADELSTSDKWPCRT